MQSLLQSIEDILQRFGTDYTIDFEMKCIDRNLCPPTYDLQPMLETPAAAMHTMHERACHVVFRHLHARLAQCIGGLDG